MQSYLELLRQVLEHGIEKPDRTGVGTRSLFGYQMRFNLNSGFPLLTTKTVNLRAVIHELLWFLRGETNVHALQAQGVHIWDEWADENGDLGPIYGAMWRAWPTANGHTIDQLADLITQIRQNPHGRRHLVTAWNPEVLSQQALPPCHVLFQFYVGDGRLSCQLYQRSADVFLGVPFNIASYSLLILMLAQILALAPGEFIHTFGDVHLYLNHVEAANKQLARCPLPLPTMTLNPAVTSLFDFHYEDFCLTAYQAHPAIRAPIAV